MLSGQKLIAVHMVQKITRTGMSFICLLMLGLQVIQALNTILVIIRQLKVTQAVVTLIRLPYGMGAIMQIILLSSVQTILKIQVALMPLVMQVQILCIISSITSNGLIITIKRKLVVPLEQKIFLLLVHPLNCQAPTTFAPPWRPESGSSQTPLLQV